MENHYFDQNDYSDDPRECVCGADVADHPEEGDLEFEPPTYDDALWAKMSQPSEFDLTSD